MFLGFKICRGTLCKFFALKKCLKGVLLNFLHKTLPGETLCKFFQIFPPKDLVYRGRQSLSHLLIR